MASFPHLDTHRAGRTLYHAHGRFDGFAIEILQLLLGNLADLRLAHRTDGPASGSLGAAVDLGRLLEEIGHRRGPHLERERAVLIHRDDDRDRCVLLQVLRLRIERLAELHDVEAALPQRRPDRRRRIRGARRDLQLEIAGNLLGHRILPLPRSLYSFSTVPNSGPTRVARPKIETATLDRERAAPTSPTTAL